tara:strand:+ start:1451 stop:1645 length:195 start_codon:yes stop_codon:yes gene_type:complete
MAIPLNQQEHTAMNCLRDVTIEFGLTIFLMRGARIDKHCVMFQHSRGFPQVLHGPLSLANARYK